ncbi:hypothetical protein PCANC_11431 [Puccinia coronata f. sp. avenae]|uniref:Uncharacterized protein n=1 Tax=Puccinia coronata f. sp. avenae TaxID=200324 RepID=A0A2N5VMN5_9BASI|nr:hypothetical protein PCANC_11431 [Puccinia coronata f. sp. avenae]
MYENLEGKNSKGPFGAREVKILHVTENYLPMGRYYLKESEIADTAQPNMTTICSTGDTRLQIQILECLSEHHKPSLNTLPKTSLASDQTVCVKSLRSHNGHLVGAEGGDVPFSDLKELSSIVKRIVSKDHFCSKVRLYMIQVPLPRIPAFVVALIASYNDEDAEDIASSHISVLDCCSKAGMSIVSIGSDGAAAELSPLRLVQKSVDQYLCFEKADAGILIQVPLMGKPPQPVVPVQDPKHARKTASNQLLSGAWLLSFGKFCANISHLVALLGESLSLYSRDVLNCDKQDDGRAYRTMNWETFEASLASPQYTGLSIYLYLFGELTDAWLSPSMIHLDRI